MGFDTISIVLLKLDRPVLLSFLLLPKCQGDSVFRSNLALSLSLSVSLLSQERGLRAGPWGKAECSTDQGPPAAPLPTGGSASPGSFLELPLPPAHSSHRS